MSIYWSPLIRNLEPYVPGEQPQEEGIIKLNTNENPYPPSPQVARAIDAYPKANLRLYPDPDARALKEALAAHYGIKTSQLFVGNGSDEVLALAFLAFFRQTEPLLFPDITYSFYPVYCNLFGIRYRTIPLDDNFKINFEDYNTRNGGIIFANPNAPTGIAAPLSAARALLKMNTSSIVAIDEAYADFGGETAIPLIEDFENLLVIRTFSKSHGLAGLRIGYAAGSEIVIEGLERVKNSFNSYPLDSLAIAGAVAAIQDESYFEETRQKVMASREWLTEKLTALRFSVLPSKTNFIFASHPQIPAALLFRTLRKNGILVRHFSKARIENYLRISIGTQKDVEKLVQVLGKAL